MPRSRFASPNHMAATRLLLPAALLLVAVGCFMPVVPADGVIPRAFAEESSPPTADSRLDSLLVGTWRSVGEEGFPDITFHELGDVSFAAESYHSTSSSGCDMEDVKYWESVDERYLRFSGDSASHDVRVDEIDDKAIRLSDDSREYVLVRVEVFESPPVLLIHGINSGANTWIDWLGVDQGRTVIAQDGAYTVEFARSSVFGEDVPVFLLDYEEYVHHSIVENAASIPWAIDQLGRVCDPSGERAKAYLVGHSMGGLISRAYLQSLPAALSPEYGIPKYEDRQDVLGLATIGTPHGGSFLMQKRFGWTLLGPVTHEAVKELMAGLAGKEMHPSSRFIEALNRSDLPAMVGYASVIGLYTDGPTGGALGDGAVQPLAQMPYRDGRGGGGDRFTWLLANRDFQMTLRSFVVHCDIFDNVGPGAPESITETSDMGIASWVESHYRRIVETGVYK